MPSNCQVQIQEGSWPVLPIFKLIAQKGHVAAPEMYRTFNMGIGFVIIADALNAEKIKAACAELNEAVYQIGTVVSGEKKVVINA